MPVYSTHELLALALAVSFAAGLNLHAVVATLGLLAQADLVTLPESLALVEKWWVIGGALVLFGVEFLADKIPLFDLVWNVLQLFVRVPAAAVLTFAAADRLPAEFQVVAAVAGGAVALVASGSKLAVRGAVSGSPEPVSNVILSVGEDLLAIALTWFATEYPWLTAAFVLVLVVIAVILTRAILAGITALWNQLTKPAAAAKAE